MKFLVVLLFLISTQAIGQQRPNGLIDPKPSEADSVSAGDKRHSLELFHRKVIGRLNGKTIQMYYNELETYLKRNRRTISTRRLTIINHDETTFPEVTQVLDLLAQLRIQKYRLVDAPVVGKDAKPGS